jgi:hypothetical protein
VFYILDIILTSNKSLKSFGTLEHIENLPNNFLKQKASFKPKVAGFWIASVDLVSDLGSINLGHEIVR